MVYTIPRGVKEIENIYLTEGMVLEHSHWTSGQLTRRAAEAESTRRGGRPGGANPLDGKHETTGERRVNLETRA